MPYGPFAQASPLAGLQPNPALAAAFAGASDLQRNALLRGLGVQPADDDLSAPAPQRPGSPIPVVPGAPPLPTSIQAPPIGSGSVGNVISPLQAFAGANPSPAASAPPVPQQQQSTTNPVMAPGAAGEPTAATPMPTFAGNSGNMIRGPMPPMPAGSPLVAAPGGGAVPQSSPLAMLAQQQGAAPALPANVLASTIGVPNFLTGQPQGAPAGASSPLSTLRTVPGGADTYARQVGGVNLGPVSGLQIPPETQAAMNALTPQQQAAVRQQLGLPSPTGSAPGSTPVPGNFGGLSNPGDIPQALQAMVTNPETGRPFTTQQYINHSVGVSPLSLFDAMQTPGGMDAYSAYQGMADRAADNLSALQNALTAAQSAATTRAVGVGDLGLRTIQQLGQPGVPGAMQLAAQQQANANAVHQDALNHEAQRQRWVSGVYQQRLAAGEPPPTPEEEQQITEMSYRMFPQGAATGGQPRPPLPGEPVAAPGGVNSGDSPMQGAGPGSSFVPNANVPPPSGGTAASPERRMLDSIWSQIFRQHATPTGAPNARGAASQRIDLSDEKKANAAITDFVARALSQPVGIGDLHAYLGERFGPQAVTRWMQQQQGGIAGVDANTAATMNGYFNALRRAGVNVGSQPAVPWLQVPARQLLDTLNNAGAAFIPGTESNAAFSRGMQRLLGQ